MKDLSLLNKHPSAIQEIFSLSRVKQLKMCARFSKGPILSVHWDITCMFDDLVLQPHWILQLIYRSRINLHALDWKEVTRSIINNCYPDLPRGVAFDMPIEEIMQRIKARKKRKLSLFNPTKQMVLEARI